jgi:aspartyl-tRNA(Asn)/glutamyl-tRNA(Gln) amidotransferase subunit A
MKYYVLTLHELSDLMRERKASVGDVLVDLKQRCDAVEPKVRAFARPPFFDKVSAGSSGSGVLANIPVVLKDNICSEGDLTECSSRILAGFAAPYDATVVTRLKNAGALIMAKANMDEFAFGSSCETSCFGTTRNPWNIDYVPGGSSGGSAACVAADEAIAALGSDTGGSIRQPASLCGVVGRKPTYGRVSRYGLIAFASSLDQIGPLTKDVEDNARLLAVIAGHDDKDATSADVPVPDYAADMRRDLKGLRCAIPKEYFVEGIDPEVRQAVEEAKAKLAALGVVFGEVSLPHTEYAVAVYYIIEPGEVRRRAIRPSRAPQAERRGAAHRHV